MIVAGASPGETKMWAAVRENGDFFALAVRITGKLLNIDWVDAARGLSSTKCLFIHPTFCVFCRRKAVVCEFSSAQLN